ncbi:hypothetical protein PORY_002164 [Pneumocystis oryctolagi]|uniref:Uncharacterized protein n=1 Tax=Pneumocystis oryctolagi TaxID=42067 RepID=A0ACB7CC92_9ASCO|nr:hypothetical protein PORY_002164 [Pneumocystis oryctolagi]
MKRNYLKKFLRIVQDKFTIITQEMKKKMNTNNEDLILKTNNSPSIRKPLPVPDIIINEKKPNKNIVIPPRPPKNYKVNSDFLCETCHKDLGCGKIISTSNKKYHLDCFFCVHCMTNLEHIAFYEHEHQLYCYLDYHELFSPRCKSCGTCIEDQAIFALENYYHPLHFFCAGCGEPFNKNIPFIEKDTYAWCQQCFEHKYYPKCEECKKPIVEDLVCAMDLKWHAKCFVCCDCYETALRELCKTCIINDVTMILSWSFAEAGRYLEMYKSLEHASFSTIQGKSSEDYYSKLVECFTSIRHITKDDTYAILSNFRSIRRAINAEKEEILMIGGWGEQKTSMFKKTVSQPFVIKDSQK